MVSSTSAIFPPAISVVAKLTSEFVLLQEPTAYLDIAIVLASLADGSGFTGSKRRIEPKDST
jgi:hypothetical protein